ncbi:MAG TPA: hypothetical protein VFG30_11155, partial [Polyangiales bacterium]|nr:hypothetical protein [Polyangiales bacterium]
MQPPEPPTRKRPAVRAWWLGLALLSMSGLSLIAVRSCQPRTSVPANLDPAHDAILKVQIRDT